MLNFNNATVVYLDDADVKAISFVDSDGGKNYFNLQCETGSDDPHIELNTQAQGVYKGAEKIELQNNRLVVT